MYTASIIDGVLAPTKEQRYAAAKKFKVYMKERVYTSERHMAMLKDFEASSTQFYLQMTFSFLSHKGQTAGKGDSG